jgi:hypothetical protein
LRKLQPVRGLAFTIMSDWIDVESGLPEAHEVVDVWITLHGGRATRLRGYRLFCDGEAAPLWLNALTDEPFPEGWRVTRWRRAEDTGNASLARSMPTQSALRKIA